MAETSAETARGSDHDFLVRIHVSVDPSLDDAERGSLLAAERDRGAELVQSGMIRRIWRVPGTQGNVGIWRAASATALHDALASLPQFRYMTIDVIPLAVHPLGVLLAEADS